MFDKQKINEQFASIRCYNNKNAIIHSMSLKYRTSYVEGIFTYVFNHIENEC